jgi:hypothetical protein
MRREDVKNRLIIASIVICWIIVMAAIYIWVSVEQEMQRGAAQQAHLNQTTAPEAQQK